MIRLTSTIAPDIAGKRAWLQLDDVVPRLILLISILLVPGPKSVAMQAHPAGSTATDITQGIQLMREGKFSEANVAFTTAVQTNPQSADALIWRGICENQLTQYRKAVQDFRNALQIDSKAQPAHYNLALSLIRLGENDEAIRELEAVVQAQPDAVDAQYDLAVLLEPKNAIAEAIQHLTRAHEAQPGDIRVIQHLLIDNLVLGRTAEAQGMLRQLDAASTPPLAQLQVGAALLERGYFRIAALLLQPARSHLAPSKENDLLLARAYIGSHDDFKAIDLLKDVEQQDASGESAYLLGLAYADAGATQEAISAFHTALAGNPNDARSLFHLGMLYSSMPDQQAEALHRLLKAVQLDAHNSTYSLTLAKVMLQGDQAQAALEVLQHTHAEGPEDAERTLLLGIAQVAVSGVVIATPTLQHAVDLNPSLALSHNVLGFCYFKQGDYARAAQAYQRASDLKPETLIFAYDTALAFERANQTAQALIYAERAVSLPSARSDDHYLLGKLYAEAGRKEDAVRELKLAVAINPDLDESYYLLARTYVQMGNSAEASDWTNKLTALKQKHDQAYMKQKSAQPNQVTSSILLKGAPIAPDQNEDLHK